jgi:co-chaperonin GroES (HSP10)
MKATRNNVLFKPFAPKEVTEGGLFVPESVRQIRDKGTIVDTGAWVKHFKAGDIVHRVHKWGEQVVIDNEIYFLMDADSILAKE